MGQKPAKVEPQPSATPEFLLSPSLGLWGQWVSDEDAFRFTLHAAKELPNGPVFLMLVPTWLHAGRTRDRIEPSSATFKACNTLGKITEVVPTFSGRSVVMLMEEPHANHHFRMEVLPNRTVFLSFPNPVRTKTDFQYLNLDYTVKYLSTYPFTPCGDPLFDNLACLFVPPPQNVADTQNNERS